MKLILLILMIAIATPLSFTLTTVKPKKTTIKRKTTTTASLNQCFRATDAVPCNTNCIYYEQKEQGTISRGANCNSDSGCFGDYYLVGAEHSIKYGCCTTNLCNYFDYVNRSLTYECISDKYKNEKPKKLLFPLLSSRSPSVSKCYECNNCTNPENEVKIVDCVRKTKTDKFSCYHLYKYIKNVKYWFGGCNLNKNTTYIYSYKSNWLKGTVCQTDLCNSVQNMRVLENATLCSDGFRVD